MIAVVTETVKLIAMMNFDNDNLNALVRRIARVAAHVQIILALKQPPLQLSRLPLNQKQPRHLRPMQF